MERLESAQNLPLLLQLFKRSVINVSTCPYHWPIYDTQSLSDRNISSSDLHQLCSLLRLVFSIYTQVTLVHNVTEINTINIQPSTLKLHIVLVIQIKQQNNNILFCLQIHLHCNFNIYVLLLKMIRNETISLKKEVKEFPPNKVSQLR